MMEDLAHQFRRLPPEYGPTDCWWWEASPLDKDRVRWHLEEMRDKGVAGTWFYPRFMGAEPMASVPPYWTEEWWNYARSRRGKTGSR